jgi:hypothetical protein
MPIVNGVDFLDDRINDLRSPASAEKLNGSFGSQ